MLSLRLALRYLFSPKSHRAVNVISAISVAAVAVAAMAIIVVLSVFNGFTDLAHKQLSRISPDLRIEARQGKVFAAADSLVAYLAKRSEVAAAAPVLADRALLVTSTKQMPVRFLAFGPDLAYGVIDLDSIVIDGFYSADTDAPDSTAATQISVGVALETGLRPYTDATASVFVPRRRGRINPANPAASYRQMPAAVSAVTQVEQQDYDNDFIFLPLDRTRSLLEYDSCEASAIYVRLQPGVSAASAAADISAALGPDFRVLDRDNQDADTFRMIAVEKWITFLMLAFILLVAAFNIISSISLIVIEKRYDMATLHALGAPTAMIRRIFINQGWLITACGGIVGIVFGVILVLIQQHFGLVRLSADTALLTIDAYPVRLAWTDVLTILAAVMLIGLLVGQISRLFTRKL